MKFIISCFNKKGLKTHYFIYEKREFLDDSEIKNKKILKKMEKICIILVDSGRKWVKMFTGQFERSIDAKNRVVLPPNIKNSLGNVFYLSISSGKKIEIRTIKGFEDFVEKIDQNNQLDPLVQKYKRFIFSNTLKIETDKLGRFLIPEHFLKAAAIENRVTFVGMGNIVEIWGSESLQNELDEFKDEETIDNLTSEMLKKGFKL